MNTILILSGMTMLALGALVVGVALISRREMPPPPPNDNEGDSKP